MCEKLNYRAFPGIRWADTENFQHLEEKAVMILHSVTNKSVNGVFTFHFKIFIWIKKCGKSYEKGIAQGKTYIDSK